MQKELRQRFCQRRRLTMAFLASMLITLLFSSAEGLSFVLLSGPHRAILAGASPETPEVELYWDGSAPELEKLSEYGDGSLEGAENSVTAEQIIFHAIEQWNNIAGSYLRLSLLRDASAKIDPDDGRNSISATKQSNLTSVAFAAPRLEGKKIADCDISLSKQSTDADAFAKTIQHELGHCIGLGHAHSNYGSIMGYSRSGRSTRLSADDRAGVIYLYPDPTYLSSPNDFQQCASLPPSSRGGPFANSAQMLALLCLLFSLAPVLRYFLFASRAGGT